MEKESREKVKTKEKLKLWKKKAVRGKCTNGEGIKGKGKDKGKAKAMEKESSKSKEEGKANKKEYEHIGSLFGKSEKNLVTMLQCASFAKENLVMMQKENSGYGVLCVNLLPKTQPKASVDLSK
ncbi:hypothetical protein QE152_g26736 [Popillia japonica]|uniref:Uncharacterized protein n=1 Tax=Popillia japonica TaxID=7064 RepID=A0AAW1JWN9_POPJA